LTRADDTASPAIGASIPPDAERKTITALFADLKGSTELIHDLDPEGARSIIDPALKSMVDAVREYDGYIVQSTGDGIFALFGAPLAHEDHPQRALHAALRMQQAVRQLAERLAKPDNQGLMPRLEARVGVNSGEVVMRTIETGGRVEYTPVGYVTNLASRLQTAAPAGGIAISEETRRLVEGYFELRSLGESLIKGVPEPVNVYEVIGSGPLRTHFQLSARRGLTKFVGRDEELAQLRRTLESVRRGRGQIAAIVAEAGTGKSRLVYEFKATIPAGCKLLEAYSVSHGKATAWLPVIELLRNYFALLDADDATIRREKIRAALAVLDASLADVLPYLCNLLSISEEPDPLAQMDGQIKRQRTLEALKRIVLRESLKQPVVIIFEDLHWIDSETQALLDLIADTIANAHVLMMVNYRPEYRHEWSNKSYYSQLRLNTLEPEHAELMVSELLGKSTELDSVKRLIIERTDGNPFFIEEMLQALFDAGVLARKGAARIARPLSQLRLPSTVQGILAARIDRQPLDYKQLLQTLAVIGRESRIDLIRQIVPTGEPQLRRMLAELQASEFIYERQTSSGTEYAFKHALTQEVAYESVLIERRTSLHERVAQAIEGIYEYRVEDHYRELAYHYRRSGNSQKAIAYLGLAGRQAAQRSANAEAVTHLTDAVNLLQTLPETSERNRQELELQIALGVPLGMLRGHVAPEVGAVYTRAQELCGQLRETSQLLPVLTGLRLFYHAQGDLQRARELGEQLLDLAQRLRDQILILGARRMLGDTAFWVGELHSAQEHFERTIALYSSHGRHSALSIYGYDEGVFGYSYAALVAWFMGYPEQGLKKAEDAVALAQELAHPYSIAAARAFSARLHLCRRDIVLARQYATACIELSKERGFAFWLTWGNLLFGRVMVEQRQEEDGIAQMRDSLAAYQTMGAGLGRSDFLALVAEACAGAGRIQEGLAVVEEALAWVEKTAEHNCEAELHRLKAELLLADCSNSVRAESCLRYAIGVARTQHAKSWELRATMSLARLLEKQGRRTDARTVLTDIYNWFTEGFDTADLKDAKALMDELSG
jgi:class 3 adenylate cyclase/predicted ATPase